MSRLYSQFLNENTNKEESNNKHNYVYWVSDGLKWYIGVRSSTIDPEKDFWKYGTSSYRKQEILTNSEMFRVYILADFNNRKEANAYEAFLHNYFNVKYNKKFWNKSNAETDFYANTKGTVSVFDKEDNRYKRVSKDEYFSNLDRYAAPSSKKVTVTFRDNPEKYFNVSTEEYYNNKHLYMTTSGIGKVLCRRRGETGKFYRIPKEEYNREEYETPSEVKHRNNEIAVEVDGIRIYKKVEDINERDKVIGDRVLVDINGEPRYISLKEFILGDYKKYKFESRCVFDINGNKFMTRPPEESDIIFESKNRRYIFNCDKSEIDKLDQLEIIKNYLKENINKSVLMPIVIFENMKLLNIDVKFDLKPSNIRTASIRSANTGRVNVYEISTQKIIKITKEEYYNNKDRYIATGAKLKKYLSQQVQQS